jgi:hypothetical protein
MYYVVLGVVAGLIVDRWNALLHPSLQPQKYEHVTIIMLNRHKRVQGWNLDQLKVLDQLGKINLPNLIKLTSFDILLRNLTGFNRFESSEQFSSSFPTKQKLLMIINKEHSSDC